MLCILMQYISSDIIRYPIVNSPEFLFQELHGLREELAIPGEPGAQPRSMRMPQAAQNAGVGGRSGDLGEIWERDRRRRKPDHPPPMTSFLTLTSME